MATPAERGGAGPEAARLGGEALPCCTSTTPETPGAPVHACRAACVRALAHASACELPATARRPQQPYHSHCMQRHGKARSCVHACMQAHAHMPPGPPVGSHAHSQHAAHQANSPVWVVPSCPPSCPPHGNHRGRRGQRGPPLRPSLPPLDALPCTFFCVQVVSAPYCERSLLCIPKSNVVRQRLLQVTHTGAFEVFVLLGILVNCVTLALDRWVRQGRQRGGA